MVFRTPLLARSARSRRASSEASATATPSCFAIASQSRRALSAMRRGSGAPRPPTPAAVARAAEAPGPRGEHDAAPAAAEGGDEALGQAVEEVGVPQRRGRHLRELPQQPLARARPLPPPPAGTP